MADRIEEVLSNIQGAIGISDFSIANLSDIAFALYKQVSKQLVEINREAGLAEVLFGGYCLIEGNFQLYKFSVSTLVAGAVINFLKEPINLKDGETHLIGDTNAQRAAREI